MGDLFDLDVDLNYFNEQYPNLGREDQSKYYDLKELKSNMKDESIDLAILNLNVRSVLSKIDEFTALLHMMGCKFDVICLTETWLSEPVQNLANIMSFNAYHRVRDGRRGGGIAIYVNEQINCRSLDDLCVSLNHVECLFLECHHKNVKFVIGCIYRPPDGDFDSFINHMEQVLQLLSRSSYTEVFICGDFNTNMLEYQSDFHCSTFLNIMSSFSYIPLITKPTRINDMSGNHSLLDNIFIRNSLCYVPGIIMLSLSDHYPVFAICKRIFEPDHLSSVIRRQYRPFNDSNISALCDSLSLHDFSNIFELDNVNEIFVEIERVIFQYYDASCPIVTKTLSHKDNIKPWIDHEVKREIKLKNSYYKLLRMGRIERAVFNRIRNRVTNLIRDKRKAYFANKFERVRNDARRTWTLINDTIKPCSNRKRGDIRELLIDGSSVSNPTLIANKLNDHFSTVGRNVANSITSLSHHREFLSGNYPNSFFLPIVTNSDVIHYIDSLKNKKCPNDCLPAAILKRISHIVAPVLCHLFNESISQCIFPDKMKVARVVPLHKGGDPNCVSNYRPISVLNIFSKLLEKHVYKHLYSYLEKNKILNKAQFGFRNSKGTTQAIVRHTSSIYDHLDRNDLVFSLYLDYRKAFDSVDHGILLDKLFFYGIRGHPYHWFKSYLTNRSQYVNINNVTSDVQFLTHSVPQGSNLGPLLFLIYINDFPSCSDFFDFLMFADDCTLTCPIKRNNLNLAHHQINFNLESVSRWTNANRIKINCQKTKFIIFSYRHQFNLDEPISIGGYEIEQVTSIKFLGVFLDKSLCFYNHVNHISRTVARCLGIFSKLREFFSINIMRSLYYALVYPHISYGIEVWYPAAPNYVKNQIEILQKKIIRVIKFLHYNAHTQPHFVDLKLLPVQYVFKYRIGQYLFKTLKISDFDSELKSKLCTLHESHNLQTRGGNKFIVPLFMKIKSDSHIHVICVRFYNCLPENVTGKNSLQPFKIELKSFLFSCIAL